VIAALRTVASGVGESALALLQAPQPSPIETVLTVLLNDLGALAADIVLVLDDYHVIDASDVQDGMAFLLDHLPPGLHVVMASRADHALPLARWRAASERWPHRVPDPPLLLPGNLYRSPSTLSAAIKDVHPQCGRELCALACVNMSGTQRTEPSSGDDFPRAVVTSPPTGGSGSV